MKLLIKFLTFEILFIHIKEFFVNSINLILLAIIMIFLSGFVSLFFSKRSNVGQIITVIIFILGSLTGLFGTILSYLEIDTSMLIIKWQIPFGEFSIAVDNISSIFLLLIFIVTPLGSIYGLGYWRQKEHSDNGKKLSIFYGILSSSMAMLVISRDAILFLICWEIMAISAYFAATVENHDKEVRSAGWIYLISTHIGTLCLFAMFTLLNIANGSFAMNVINKPVLFSSAIFILALIGFGFKAGIVPLHIWLPGAHSGAPSHVSAVMSGVMLKMGIYGIIRILTIISAKELWQGITILIIGLITGLTGIIYALSQRDIKRLLAYSSIENIGIIISGIGLSIIGKSLERIDLTILGLAGAFLHIFNHGFFKPLMFFGAGSIIHTTHTRDMERMGGLLKKMPLVGTLFILGSIAICALPPLNGFISEILIYTGFFKAITESKEIVAIIGGIGAVSLAMIGAIALASFVKILSTVFLGSPRTEDLSNIKDHTKKSMLFSMIILIILCFVISLYPLSFVYIIDKALKLWYNSETILTSLKSFVSLDWIAFLGIVVLIASILLYIIIKLKIYLSESKKSFTWDCGYAKPNSRMQYTGNSFSQNLVNQFRFILLPKVSDVRITKLFPKKTIFTMNVYDVLLNRIITPFFLLCEKYFPWVRILQQGLIQVYVLYIFLIVIILFIFIR